MLALEISNNDIEKYKSGTPTGRKKKRAIEKILGLKPIILTPSALLSRGKFKGRSELSNPERRKIPMLLLKILPSTLCMTVTVSVIMSFKENMTASDIVSGILKLSALPLIGFKGYSEGYSYAKNSLSLWLETKANILNKFTKQKTETKITEIE
jgi:hypothetical protein